ncbi:hypothetical protein L207DRAFT_483493 [Hyaloscypha variabilis F]|uniref:PBP domain-containing protein n=1 Tax=Hyaloscypha variabilis (strain UAMH 11265 / GT02V1 / F) TaxID=1149755 RepID=A0A2J6S1A2_HYAVF|nr:hypothetical protein L207DRAFT_483493 [Hyaloscypha variabilis F]
MASISLNPNHPPHYIEATEVYRITPDKDSPIKLRIASGGAGQSGLIRAFAEDFIKQYMNTAGASPFAVAWMASDTTMSFNSLALKAVDMSITYHPIAENTAIQQGIADRREYIWRDHWMLVGPKSNPANLPTSDSVSIYDLFTHLFCACIESQTSKSPIRFLSRYDKSAANIKESSLWTAIGQTPWSHPWSSWYHTYIDFPFRALEVAALLGEYSLVDKGTWWSVEPWVREKLMIFKVGGDKETDPLLNPAHALVSSKAENSRLANAFVDWLISEDGGQAVVRNFSKNGVVLYSAAPAPIPHPSTST